MITPETPELDRQREIIDSGQAMLVQSFLDWLLDDQQFVLSKWLGPEDDKSGWYSEQPVPVYPDRERLMQEFFGIDPAKIEAERQAILAALRRSDEGEEG